MGALDEGSYNVELNKGVKLMGGGGCCVEHDLDGETQTLANIQEAVKVLLQGLGEDVDREGLRKTPLRVAKALREGTRGYRQNVKDIVQGALFPETGLESGVGQAGGVGGLVLVRDIDLFSYCESCLLPFQVKCHVGYIPSGQRVVGLSKLSRVADIFAKRLQDPQRLANEICIALQQGIKPTGVAVILQCSHIHFPNFESAFLDLNHQMWINSTVSAGSGDFEDENAAIWDDLLGLLRRRDLNAEKIHSRGPVEHSWCPSQALSKAVPASSEMIQSVGSMIESLGEDLLREELIGTPTRFVKWLMNFKKSNLEIKLNGFVRLNPLMSNGDVSNVRDYIRSELNLSLWSLCEHHLLPFHGVVHIGYLSAEEMSPIGKSLLQSIVHFHGFKLQVQERLTRQIAESISSFLGGDVMVVVEASHTCMISRGIEKFGSNTCTIAVLGQFSTNPGARTQFLQSIPSYSPV